MPVGVFRFEAFPAESVLRSSASVSRRENIQPFGCRGFVSKIPSVDTVLLTENCFC